MTNVAAGKIRRTRRGIEVQDRGAAGASTFPQQKSGDDKAGNHEEHIDPDKPTGHPGDVGVIEDDEQDGDRSETFYVGSKAPVIRCGSRFVAGGEKLLVKS